MPRNISVSKKYLPARSSVESFSSSHLGGRGRRNPFGGGPAGVAYVRRWEIILARAAAGKDCFRSSWRDSIVAVAVEVASPCILVGFPDVGIAVQKVGR